jgi:hypothetical protein
VPRSMPEGPGHDSRSTHATHGRRRVGTLVVAAALLLLAAVVVGCGSSDDDEGTTTTTNAAAIAAGKEEAKKASKVTTHIDASDVVKTFPPTVVTDGDVDELDKGTPERAFLEWWQAWQFHDGVTVEDLTSKATLDAIGADELEELVSRTSLGGIEVLSADENGNSATINAGLLNFQPPKQGAPPPREPTASQPQTFAMAQEDGQWVFAETPYLQLKADALQR